MKEFMAGKLMVKACDSRPQMAQLAADDAAEALRTALAKKEEINIIFAAAPSQSDFLDALSKAQGIDWGRVNAYHMDEYVGLPTESDQSFVAYLKANFWDKVPLHTVYALNTAAKDAEAECSRYSALLEKAEIDFVFMGIGENGHIAFNDPSVADFKDSKRVKVVKLETVCRQQQVHDGCFAELDLVPEYAMTLTVPQLIQGKRLFCVVPAKTKAQAVYHTIYGEVSEKCPASILKTHDNACLYLEPDSASLLK